MKKNLTLLVLVIFLMTGCSNNKGKQETISNQESNNIELSQENQSLINRVNEYENKVIDLEKSIEEYKIESREDKVRIEDLHSNVINLENKLEDKIKKESLVSIAGIRLGYSKEQVEEILGSKFKIGSWTQYDVKGMTYEYQGLTIFINQEQKVHQIILNEEGYTTDFEITVGTNAKEAIQLCDNLFNPLIGHNTDPNNPRVGWYQTNNDIAIIIELTKDSNFNNDKIIIDDEMKVERIKLAYKWMFD